MFQRQTNRPAAPLLPPEDDFRRNGQQQADERAAMLYFMRQHELTPAQAAGIVGNLVHESRGLRADLESPAAFGVAQWAGPREKRLREYAQANGQSPTDLQTQLEFIVRELTQYPADARVSLDDLRQPRSVRDATAAFLGYERPRGYDPENIEGTSGWDSRQRNAERLYETYRGLVPAPAEPPPGPALPPRPPQRAVTPQAQAEFWRRVGALPLMIPRRRRNEPTTADPDAEDFARFEREVDARQGNGR